MPKRRAADKLQQNKFRISSEVSRAITNNIQRQDLTLQPVNRSSSDVNRENTNNFLRDQQQNIPATSITSAQLNRAIAVNQEETRRIKSHKIRANDEGFEFNQVETPQPPDNIFIDFNEVTEIEDTFSLVLTTRNIYMANGNESNLEQQQINTVYRFAIQNNDNLKKSPQGFENYIFPAPFSNLQTGGGGRRFNFNFKKNKKYRFDLSDISLSSIQMSGFSAFDSIYADGTGIQHDLAYHPQLKILTKSNIEPGNVGSFFDITLTNNISSNFVIDYFYDLTDSRFYFKDRLFSPFDPGSSPFQPLQSQNFQIEPLLSINPVDTNEFFAISASFDPYATTLEISAFEQSENGREKAGYHLAGVDRDYQNKGSFQPSLENPLDISSFETQKLYTQTISGYVRFPLGTSQLAEQYTQPFKQTQNKNDFGGFAKPTIEAPNGYIDPLNEVIFARPGDLIKFSVTSLSGSFNTSDGQIKNLSGENIKAEIKVGNNDIFYFNSLNPTLTSGELNSIAPGIISSIPIQSDVLNNTGAGNNYNADNENYFKDLFNSQYQRVCNTTRNIFKSYLSTFPVSFYNRHPSLSSFSGGQGCMNLLLANGALPRGAKYGYPKFSLEMKKYFRDTLPEGSLIPGNQAGIGTLSSGNPDFWGWNARKLFNFSGVSKFAKGTNAGNESILLTPRHAIQITHFSDKTLAVPGDILYFYDNTTGQPISAVIEDVARFKKPPFNKEIIERAVELYRPFNTASNPGTEVCVIKFTEPLTAHDVKSYKLLEQCPVFNLSAIKPGMFRIQRTIFRGGTLFNITFFDSLTFDFNRLNSKFLLPGIDHARNMGFGINNSGNPNDSSIKWSTFSQYTYFDRFYRPSFKQFTQGYGLENRVFFGQPKPSTVAGALTSLNPYTDNSFLIKDSNGKLESYVASYSGLNLNKITNNLKLNKFGRINSGDSSSPEFVIIEDEIVPLDRTSGGTLQFHNNKQFFQYIIDELGNPENFQVQTIPMTGTGL